MIKFNRKIVLFGAALVFALVGCGGFVYTTVGGKVSGLGTGNSLVLVNESNYSDTLTKDGDFSFRVASNGSYTITVDTQPNAVHCTVVNGSGKMTSEAPVTNVLVNCVPNVPLAGTLTGLADASSLQLAVNGFLQTALSANGSFPFQTYIVDGQNYVVTIGAPPTAQVCNVSNGTGIAHISDIPASSRIAVNCVAGVPVGGTVTGLKVGTSLVVTNNGTDIRNVYADGKFIFTFSLLDNEAYNVAVTTQPTGQKCTVANGTGKTSLAAPLNSQAVAVTCVAG